MTPVPELESEAGGLWIAEPTLSVLVNYATGKNIPLAETTDSREQLALLRSAGVLDESGKPPPAVLDALEAMAHPEAATLELSYSGKAMLGWAGYPDAALLLPAGEDGRRRLVSVPVSLLPESLSRLVDLRWRPRPQLARSVPYYEGALAGIRRHWQLSAAWMLEDGTPATRVLEVVDTESGLWMLRPSEDGGLMAWPSTSTSVFRCIVRLVMRR